MSTVLGIDIGTQSVKVLFYDAEKRECVAVASAPLALHQTDAGVAEQQAEWWIHALQTAMYQVEKPIRQSVAAISVSGQQHGFVPLDKSGEVLAPVKLWCDTSTTLQCDEISEGFGGIEACIEVAGNPIRPGYTASKVRWFKETHPDLYAKLDCILLPHDYINYYLTGERCTEAGDASGTGFFDVRNRTWSDQVLRAIDSETDLRECLPAVATENMVIGTLLPDTASKLGLPSATPVAIGGGDNMMGAIGTGNVYAGKVTMSLGTSGTVYAFSNHPVIDKTGNVAAFCSSTGGWLPLVCTMNCTVGSELMRQLLSADLSMFENQLLSAQLGAGGLLTVPYFNGERTPNLPHAKACIFGLDSSNTTSENLLRSAVEGATFGLRFGLSELVRGGVLTEEIVLTGGGANSEAWRQIVADVCGIPVKMLKSDEGAAFGAALQALDILSEDSLANLTNTHLETDSSRCCEPQSSAVEHYSGVYESYQLAVEQVANLYR